MSKRLMVIGLDGAEWSLIRRWTEQGRLPTFKKLIDNGTSGLLKSTIPINSAAAWTTAFTGVNLGKHNIFDFFVSKGHDLRLTNATDRKAKAVWEILSEKGLKVIVVNVPLTYPPDSVNGIMISGIVGLSWVSQALVDYTYPKEFKSKLERIGYLIDLTPTHAPYILRILDMIEKRRRVVVDLVKNNDWDLFIVVFTALDRVQHRFWKHAHTSGNGPTEKNPFRDVIFRTYEALDDTMKELLKLTGKNTNFIFLSDHGFGTAQKAIFLNKWFEDLGLLKRLEVGARAGSGLLKSGLNEFLKKIMRGLPDNIKAPVRTRRKPRGLYRITRPRLLAPYAKIDWSKTKAWLAVQVRINLQGREPSGIVRSEEYEELRDYIIRKLSMLTDPDNGERVIERVFKREELCFGPYTKNGPDLVIQHKQGYYSYPTLRERLFDKPTKVSGVHRLHGVFFAYGPDIQKGNKIKNAEIIDVTPTILHMLGLSIPKATDGRVLKEIFEKESELSMRTILHEDFKEKRVRTKEIFTEEEEDEITKRLERLGYI